MTTGQIDLPIPPDEAMQVLREAVAESGGAWREGDREPLEFALPTRAGIREGHLRLQPLIEATTDGCRLSLRLQEESLEVNLSAAMVLLLGAIGGLLVVLWPLHPTLLSLAPVGAILALAAWLLVASRSRGYGQEELLNRVAELAYSKDDAAST